MTSEPKIVELETGVYARLHEGLTNGGIIIGDESVLVIDSLRVPSFARDLISDVNKLTRKPIKYVINTHSHWDHSWGNQEFLESIIIGHQNCYQEMLDIEWNASWRQKIVKAHDSWSEEANLVNITPPNMLFDTTMQLHFGSREIDLVYLGKAHTSGDIFIYLPEDRIVFTGDVAQDKGVPYLGDCYPRQWPETDDLLIQIQADRFISGHGPIGNHEALIESRDFICALVDNLQFCIQDGRDEPSATSYTVDALAVRFGDWRNFDRLKETLPGVYRKLKI